MEMNKKEASKQQQQRAQKKERVLKQGSFTRRKSSSFRMFNAKNNKKGGKKPPPTNHMVEQLTANILRPNLTHKTRQTKTTRRLSLSCQTKRDIVSFYRIHKHRHTLNGELIEVLSFTLSIFKQISNQFESNGMKSRR